MIECCGVLHHLENPENGLRALRGKLNDNGIMLLSIYSRMARTNLKEIQDFIADNKISPNGENSKYLRELLKVRPAKSSHHVEAKNIKDFFSRSMFRDLLFHEQEHTFDLLEVKQLRAVTV